MHTGCDSPCILFLCDYQAPYGGNFIASLVRLDARLSARGVRTLYVFPQGAFCRDWCDRMRALGLTLIPLSEGGTRARTRQLLSLIDEHHVTILHVHFGLFPLAERVALLRRSLRLILHYHSDFSGGRAPNAKDRLRALGKGALERLIGERRITKVTVSEGSARTTKDCVALHNALVVERFTDECWTRERTRAACGVSEGQTFALVFGWTPLIKGVDVAAKAVRRLVAAGHEQFTLGVVCGRTVTEERMRAFLTEKAGVAPDAPWIRYLPPVEDVFRYHKASDIMISSSRSETFSYALLEALYTGRPCAVSDIPGVRWAESFDTVSFFPTEDDEALSKTLLHLDGARKAPAFQARLKDASARAQSEYAIDEWIDGMLDIYGIT